MTILEIASLFSKLSGDNEEIILEQMFIDNDFIFYISIDEYSIERKNNKIFINNEEIEINN